MSLSRRYNFSQLWRRITANRLSFSFFLFTFVTCFAQGILHSLLFSLDSEYNVLLSGITKAAGLPECNHTYIEGTSGYWGFKPRGEGNLKLYMCEDVPRINCTRVFESNSDSDVADGAHNSIMRGRITQFGIQSGMTLMSFKPSNAEDPAVRLLTSGGAVDLNRQCTQILNYPQQHMHKALREDITLVIFQFWLLAMTIYAMCNDSVPHIVATLFARTLLLGWSAYAINRTQHQKLAFYELVEKPGTPCSVELFQGYFSVRMGYEIADIVLNTASVLTAVYLSWTLLKLFNNQSVKCVGAPAAIVKMQKILLAFMSVLHLELFTILLGFSLWLDQLLNSYIKAVSLYTPSYVAGFILVCVFIVPYIATGYYAVSREKDRLMLGFIFFGGGLVFGPALMFYSQVYRWTFLMWPYFGCYTVASFLLTITAFILAIICRMNFGKGLAQYLRAEAVLSASNFKSEVFEHDTEKALSADDDSPLPSPGASTLKLDLSLKTKGDPIIAPGSVISPVSMSTKEAQVTRGERESQVPIPTYYLSYKQEPLVPNRRESNDSSVDDHGPRRYF